ncbi:hypothetical protein LTR17_027319, partial [Elasticomyces elasticus]
MAGKTKNLATNLTRDIYTEYARKAIGAQTASVGKLTFSVLSYKDMMHLFLGIYTQVRRGAIRTYSVLNYEENL